jgi:TorA maturation chaperone TorD
MTPRDWDRLTVEETDHLLNWLEAYTERMQEAADKAKRR